MSGILYFSDLHISQNKAFVEHGISENTMDAIAALSQFSQDYELTGITNGDLVDAKPMMVTQMEAVQIMQNIDQIPEEQHAQVEQELMQAMQMMQGEYVGTFEAVNGYLGEFHGGKVYGVGSNHHHPTIEAELLTNMDNIEGKLVDIEGRKFTGLNSYSARFFDQEADETEFGNLESQIRDYEANLEAADVLVIHELPGQKYSGTGNEYKPLMDIIAGNNLSVACGHKHGKLLEENEGTTITRSAPDTAYTQFYNVDTDEWDTFEVNLPKLIKYYDGSGNNPLEADVAGTIGPEEVRLAA